MKKTARKRAVRSSKRTAAKRRPASTSKRRTARTGTSTRPKAGSRSRKGGTKKRPVSTRRRPLAAEPSVLAEISARSVADALAEAAPLAGLINPTEAMCHFDRRSHVLCCSSCGACGAHAHGNCSEFTGLKDPVVATCALATCRLAGVLCCSVCGNCGKHPHAHF